MTAVGRVCTRSCMFQRDCYLVKNADLLPAVFDGREGGTRMTIDMAREEGIQVLIVPPVSEEYQRDRSVEYDAGKAC